MRPRYGTGAIVLARTPLAEASALLYLLTPEFGLVKVRAQGLRKPSAKLAGATQTLSESDVTMVRGKDGWRLAGALLSRAWARELSPSARMRAGRIVRLILRLVAGETRDPELFHTLKGLLAALSSLPESEAEAAECLAALRVLRALGLDAGELPGGAEAYAEDALAAAHSERRALITRINRGIAASGL